MKYSEIVSNISLLIQKNKVDEALNVLNQLNIEEFRNTITLLKSRLKKLNDDEIMGNITREVYNASLARISLNVLSLTSELADKDSAILSNGLMNQIKDKSIKYIGSFKFIVSQFYINELTYYNSMKNSLSGNIKIVIAITILTFIACFLFIMTYEFKKEIITTNIICFCCLLMVSVIIIINSSSQIKSIEGKSNELKKTSKSISDLAD